MTQQQKRIIPQNYVEFNNPVKIDLEFYWNNNNENPVAICFSKKAKKPSWHYRFKDFTQFQKTINDTVNNRLDHQKKVVERRQKRFAPHSFNIGDYLYCSWGYDQTNINFYKVTKLIGKNKIEVVRCKNKITGSGCQSDYVIAGEEIKGSEKNYIVNSQYNSIRVHSFASASKWNGEAKFQTDSLFGH